MQFVKNLFKKDAGIIGLCGLRKNTSYSFITIPESYKQTFVTNSKNNYILF